jgi:PIN domain
MSRKAASKASKPKPPALKIVFDNNVVFQHRRLEGPQIDLLSGFIKRTGSTFVLPKITLEEACKKHREDLVAKTQDVKKAIEKLNGVLGYDSKAVNPTLDIEREVDEYRNHLLQMVNNLGGEIAEYDDLPIRLIATRALAERRPFKAEDKGCRDAIFWETVLSKVAQKDFQTTIVTNDAGFSEDGKLHPHLLEDVMKLGFDESSVILFSNLEQFLNRYAKPLPPIHMKDVVEKLLTGRYTGFSVSDFVAEYTDEIIEASNPFGSKVAGGANWDEAAVSFEPPIEITYSSFDKDQATPQNVVEIDKHRVFIEAVLPCMVTIDGFIFKSDYYSLSDEAELSVLDDDWNDHYIWAEVHVSARTKLAITYNVSNDEIDDWEVTEVEAYRAKQD